jgi:hypothetical protein
MKKKITVKHFYRPNGCCEYETVEIDERYFPNYCKIIECGCRITAEVLTTSVVSLCIENPEMGDFDIKICENNGSTIEILEKMIDNFSEEEYKDWLNNRINYEKENWE